MIGLQNILVCLVFGLLLSAWQRAFEVFAGDTFPALAVFAGFAFLASVAGAAFVSGLFRRVRHLGRWPAVGFLLAALTLAAQLLLIPRLTHEWQQMLLLTINRPYGVYLRLLLKTGAIFFVPLAFFLSAALQINWHLFARERLKTGEFFLPLACSVSLTVLMGYGVLGWLLAAVPVEWISYCAMVLLGAVAALSVSRARSLGLATRYICAALALAVAVIPLAFLPSSGHGGIFANGLFGRFADRDSGFFRGIPEQVVLTRRHAFVSYADPDYSRVAALDGRPVCFGNRFHSSRTLAAYTSLLMAPRVGRAVLCGSEAGTFVPYFFHAGVTNLAVAYAEPKLTRALLSAATVSTNEAAAFAAAIRYEAPKRHGKYDLIFVASDPAWTCFADSQFSLRRLTFYRKALAPDGIVALHVDARALTPEAFAVIVRRFLSVFPGVQLWNVGLHDWVLLGGAKCLTVSLDAATERFDRESVFADRVRAGNVAITEAFACMVAETPQLHAWLDTKKPLPFFAAAWDAPRRMIGDVRNWLMPESFERYRSDRVDWILPGSMERELYRDLLSSIVHAREARPVVIRALGKWSAGNQKESLEALEAAVRLLPRDALIVEMIDRLELDARRRISIGDYKGAQNSYLFLLMLRPDQSIFHYGLGLALRHLNKPELALQEFRAAVANEPKIMRYRMALAEAALAAKCFGEADQMYRDLLNREPENVEVLFHYSQSLGSRLRGPNRALREAIKYGEYACKLTQFKNREYVYGLADLYIDAGRVLEGVALKRQWDK